MRCALPALALFFVACQPPKDDQETTTVVRAPGAIQDTAGIGLDETTKLIRATEQNVRTWDELRRQGKLQQMTAVRRVIGRAVDDNFDDFRRTALKADTIIVRNMAVKCIPFAYEQREEARDTLLVLCKDRDITILSNAVLGLGILLDKKTDLAPVIALLAHGKVEVRTSAGTALIRLFLIRETPRELSPQYITAMDRLVTMLHDESSIRSRRAAAWALANMRHPDTLPHLTSALRDDDKQVQWGGLNGIKLLGDQRSLEAVLDYLSSGPSEEGESWAIQALESIAVQGGFAKHKSELKDLGTSPRAWRAWFRERRMK